MKIITPAEFKKDYLELFRSIFAHPSEPRGPFTDRSWHRAFLAGGLIRQWDKAVYQALSVTAQEVGDSQLIVSIAENDPPVEKAVILPWDLDLIENEVWKHTNVSAFDYVAFDQSGTWGSWSDYEEFTCLGGTRTFMDRFLKRAGDPRTLKDRFNEWAREFYSDPLLYKGVLRAIEDWALPGEL